VTQRGARRSPGPAVSVAGVSEYELDDDPARVDVDVLWAFLSTEAYWGRWRTRDDVVRQLQGSWRVLGAYAGTAMVGYARAISDGVSLAYLADVFVLREHRGRGVGMRLIAGMVEEGPGREFRWLLNTSDPQIYERFGFVAPDATLLERPAR
jgi:GNAT superfamily N-acetyltransferase